MLSLLEQSWSRHTQKHFQVVIEGTDITSFVEEIGDIELSIDAETLTSFKVSDMNLVLNNNDRRFSPELYSNFFTDAGYVAHGHLAKIVVSLGFKSPDGNQLQILFCGHITSIDSTTEHTRASIIAVDESIKFREKFVHDFGVSVTNYSLDNGNYSATNFEFDFLDPWLPVSIDSITNLTADAVTVTLVPSIRTFGLLSNLNADVDYPSGIMMFEDEPASQGSTDVEADFKAAYRYKRLDGLVRKILTGAGLTDLSLVERVKLKHFDTTADKWYSSHGRPNWENNQITVVRSMIYQTATAGDKLYLLQDTKFVEYDVDTDEYTELATVPGSHTGLKMTTTDYLNFFFLTTNHKEGDSSDPAQEIRIYKWSSAGGWVTVADESDEEPQTTIFYDIGSAAEPIAENRSSFIIITDPNDSKDYLYFRFTEDTNAGTPRYAGVKRYDIAGDTFATIIQFDWSDKFGAHHGLDFVVDLTNEYVYTMVTFDDNTSNVVGTFEVWRSDLDGANDTSLYSETYPGSTETIQKPFSVCDLVLDEPNDKIYYMLQLGHTSSSEGLIGKGELKYFDISSPGVTLIKSYTRFTQGARSGYLYSGNAYYLEGTQWDYWQGTYGAGDVVGHLIELNNGTLTDKGLVWKSRDDVSNQGVHSGFPSNIVDDGDNLLFIAGYGLLGAIETSARTSPATQDLNPGNRIDNYHLIQWGYEIAAKIAQYTPNKKKVQSELEVLARLANAEVGLDCDQYFFRPRSVVKSTIDTEISVSASPTTIAIADASRFPDTGALPDGVGYLLIDSEVFSYTGVTGNTLTGVTRAVEESVAATHKESSTIYYINHRAYNHPRRENLVGIPSSRPDYNQVQNEIHVTYDLNDEVIDPDTDSITEHGNRPFSISESYLGEFDRPWAEILGREYRTERSTLQNLIRATIKINFLLKPGETILIDHSERVELRFRLCRLLRVRHSFDRWQTEFEARTIFNPPFNFNSLGPVVWLDGDVGTGVSDNNPVSTWEDQSGNSNDAIAAGTERPLLQVDEINNHDALDFDGINDYMDLGDPFISTFDGSFTIAIVVQPEDGIPTGVERFTGANHDANNFIGIANSSGMVQFSYSADGNAATAETDSAVFADGQETVHIITCVADSTISGVGGLKIYFDGIEEALDATNDGDTSGIIFADFAGVRELYIGARNSLGSPGNFFEGFIADFHLIPSALSGDDLNNLHVTLKTKYGI